MSGHREKVYVLIYAIKKKRYVHGKCRRKWHFFIFYLKCYRMNYTNNKKTNKQKKASNNRRPKMKKERYQILVRTYIRITVKD